MEEEAGDKAEAAVEADSPKAEEVKASEAKAEEVKAVETPPVVSKTADVKPPAPRPAKDNLSILDLATGVLCLVVSSLLIGNSYVAYIGKNYNERFVKESIALAGKAATEGLDTPHVQLAAYGSWNHCAFPGFFVERPEFVSFKDEITPERRLVTISARTRVRVPAPFLIFDKTALDEDDDSFQHITFKHTYCFQLNNPKNIRGTLIQTPKGVIKVPSGADTPATPKVEGAPAPDNTKTESTKKDGAKKDAAKKDGTK